VSASLNHKQLGYRSIQIVNPVAGINMLLGHVKPGAQMTERRKTDRLDAAKEALVFFASNKSIMHCVAVNFSKKGAKIALNRPYAVPRRLLLSFDSFDTARSSRVVWSRGNFAGLEFIKAL
jgi:hypothetical protein